MIPNQIIFDAYTDIVIDLIDETVQIVLPCHRVVLASASQYFDRMFRFQPQESKFQMRVPNATIMELLIKSFYGIKIQELSEYQNLSKWLIDLEMIRCQNYLLMDLKTDLLHRIEISSEALEAFEAFEAFELFVEIACLFDIENDHFLIHRIRQSMPPNYPIDRLSVEFADLLNCRIQVIICSTICGENSITVIDFNSGLIISKIKIGEVGMNGCYNRRFTTIALENIIGLSSNNKIKRINIRDNTCQEYTMPNYAIKDLLAVDINGETVIIAMCELGKISMWKLNPWIEIYCCRYEEEWLARICLWNNSIDDTKYIISAYSNDDIVSRELLTGRQISIIDRLNVNSMFTTKNNLLVVLYNEKRLKIRNLYDGLVLYDAKIMDTCCDQIAATSNEKIIAIRYGNGIALFDMATLQKTHHITINFIANFCFSSDDQLVYLTKNEIGIINIETTEIIKKYPIDNKFYRIATTSV